MKRNLRIILGVLFIVIFAIVFIYFGNDGDNKRAFDNENVNIEYVENKDGTWEVYIQIKDGQSVSEVNASDQGDSLLIAPDIK